MYPRHPDTDWGTPKLKQMELHFNAGHFQCFTDGELRADFHDPGFSPIEIIGFVIQGTNLHVGTAWVDAFTISGPSLPVSPPGETRHNLGAPQKTTLKGCAGLPVTLSASQREQRGRSENPRRVKQLLKPTRQPKRKGIKR